MLRQPGFRIEYVRCTQQTGSLVCIYFLFILFDNIKRRVLYVYVYIRLFCCYCRCLVMMMMLMTTIKTAVEEDKNNGVQCLARSMAYSELERAPNFDCCIILYIILIFFYYFRRLSVSNTLSITLEFRLRICPKQISFVVCCV